MTWNDVLIEDVRADPQALVDRVVRLSNPWSGVTVEGECTDVDLSWEPRANGTVPIFTLEPDPQRPVGQRWPLWPPDSDPMYAVRCEVLA